MPGVLLPIATYIISLFCSDFRDTIIFKASTVRLLAYILAAVYTIDFMRRIVLSVSHRYNYQMLYEDIKNMNQITHNFSLIAMKDEYNKFSNHFLLYYDSVWKCWFFPNYKTQENENEEVIAAKLSYALHVEKRDIALTYITEKIQPKFSRKDQINKVYSHRLYQGKLSEFPEILQAKNFVIDGVRYCWMTIAEMENDDIIREVNGDVVSLVKDSIQ